jgi:hypothetical protein
VKKDGRIVGGEELQEKVHNREEWKKFLLRNHRILHIPIQLMNKNFERNNYSSNQGRNHFCSGYGDCRFFRNCGKHLK